MRKLIALFIIAAVVSLTGCAALKGPQAEQKSVVTACNAYASALATAAAFRSQGKLSKSQISHINDAVQIAHPVCSASTIPSTQTALSEVESATAQLTAANQKVKQ